MMEAAAPAKEEYYSKEQFYKICHISKATALRLIRDGLVPAIDTKKQTNRYLIAKSDVEAYLYERNRNPKKYGYTPKLHFDMPEEKTGIAANMRQIIEDDLKDAPDLLSTEEVSEVLGYNTDTISRWIRHRELKCLKVAGRNFVPKVCLPQFVTEPFYQNIHNKSEKHIELIRRAYNEGE